MQLPHAHGFVHPCSPAPALPAVNRHRAVLGLFEKQPSLGSGAFVAPTAAVIGDVRLGERASVFYGSVLNGADPGVSAAIAAPAATAEEGHPGACRRCRCRRRCPWLRAPACPLR